MLGDAVAGLVYEYVFQTPEEAQEAHSESLTTTRSHRGKLVPRGARPPGGYGPARLKPHSTKLPVPSTM